MLSKILEKYDVIIFDCDGVIIDSNSLKCEAFGKTVSDYPKNVVGNFVEHCRETFGISRYVKFKEFFHLFANEPFNEEKYQYFIERYGELCKQLYFEAELTSGVEYLLKFIKQIDKKTYIASGSDEKELVEVFKRRDLAKYFNAIYGSPKKKNECVLEILSNNPRKKVLFIGDAISDLYTAQEYSLDFIYMCKYSIQSKKFDELCRSESIMVINSFEDFIIDDSIK